MVRLVFRPYTQVRRSICTSESLRASTRVSPGFALLKHSSPSFGSQHVRSHSNRGLPKDAGRRMVQAHALPPLLLSLRARVSITPALAYMLDSLVRVSRRGKGKHFDRAIGQAPTSAQTATTRPRFRCKHPTSEDAKSRGHRTRPDKAARAAPRTKAQGQYARSQHCFPSVPFQQFQALFNSLSKVLFIFPSRYLFAIGLSPVFSLRWDLPPN